MLTVLRDWSSAGLIGPVLLIDVDALAEREILIPALLLEVGCTRPVLLQDELSSHTGVDAAVLVAVSEITTDTNGPGTQTGERLSAVMASALPAVDLTRIHLVALALQGPQATEPLAWLGWHNLVLAPENAASPSTGVLPIVASAPDPVRCSHLVGALCSLSGLWLADPHSPLATRPVSPGRSLSAVRTFSRHLSATAVQSELLRRLADVQHGYPVPLVDGSRAVQVEDPGQAATGMADRLLAKHPGVLPRERRMPARAPQTRIGGLQALKMLFAFLGAVIRNAPRTFVERLTHRVSTAVAGSVSRMVYGTGDSQYLVVVGGVTSDGTPASWAEIDDALDGLVTRASGRMPVNKSQADLAAFWNDFVGGALTLLDGGSRSAGLDPLTVGGQRGVVSLPGAVVPDPDDGFHTPELVGAYVHARVIQPADGVGARLLNSQLDDVATSTPHVTGPARTAQANLRSWFAPHERTYAGRVGQRLGEGIGEVRRQITEYSEYLRSAQASSAVPAAIEEQQRRLARNLRAILFVALALIVVVVALAFGPLTWVFLAGAVAFVVISWLAGSLIVFIRGQRDLFALLHEREDLVRQVDVVQRHLLDALEDLRRLGRTYRQYLDWSRALGRFVVAPMGSPSVESDADVLLGSGLPRNHRFGAARPDSRAIDEMAAEIRRDLFVVGWASDSWAAYLADLPDGLGHVEFRLRERPDLLFEDPAGSETPLLTRWAERVVERRAWAGAVATLRSRLYSISGPSRDRIRPALLARVERRDPDGSAVVTDYTTFVSGLDDQAMLDAPHQSLARDMFGPRAFGEPWRVASTLAHQPAGSFSQTLVVTQLTDGFEEFHLGFAADAPLSVPGPGSDSTDVIM